MIHFTSAMLIWLMTVAHRLGERPVRSDSEIFAAWKRIGLLRRERILYYRGIIQF
jgi:hypothetical protein